MRMGSNMQVTGCRLASPWKTAAGRVKSGIFRWLLAIAKNKQKNKEHAEEHKQNLQSLAPVAGPCIGIGEISVFLYGTSLRICRLMHHGLYPYSEGTRVPIRIQPSPARSAPQERPHESSFLASIDLTCQQLKMLLMWVPASACLPGTDACLSVCLGMTQGKCGEYLRHCNHQIHYILNSVVVMIIVTSVIVILTRAIFMIILMIFVIILNNPFIAMTLTSVAIIKGKLGEILCDSNGLPDVTSISFAGHLHDGQVEMSEALLKITAAARRGNMAHMHLSSGTLAVMVNNMCWIRLQLLPSTSICLLPPLRIERRLQETWREHRRAAWNLSGMLLGLSTGRITEADGRCSAEPRTIKQGLYCSREVDWMIENPLELAASLRQIVEMICGKETLYESHQKIST